MPNECSTVIIIDDDTDHRKALADLIEDEGFTIEEAMDGVEGLAVISRYKEKVGEIAAILLNVVMPGMGGDEMLKQVADNIKGKVIVFSSLCFTDKAKAEKFPGVKDVLTTPLNIVELIDSIRNS